MFQMNDEQITPLRMKCIKCIYSDFILFSILRMCLFAVSPESIVIPIVSCIFGFPLLALLVICCLRHRAKMARERDRRRNYDLQDHAVSLVRFSPIHRLSESTERSAIGIFFLIFSVFSFCCFVRSLHFLLDSIGFPLLSMKLFY